ncbi:MAG: IS607 family transposase [Firmicutes bacterium]|nr:IS607 family transposase [Bacillota bacterium]
MDDFVSIAEARRRLGVSSRTLRRWDAQGVLQTIRSPGGRRMFSLESISRLAGERSGQNRAVIYARVSSIKQKRDGNLDRQRERLLNAAKERGYRIVEVIAEQASGINEKRRGLRRIFRLAEDSKIDIVLIEFRDRLARFGYSYIETYLSARKVRVVCLDDAPPASTESELTRDLITIITVFSARLYGQRSRGFRKKVTDVIHEHHAAIRG